MVTNYIQEYIKYFDEAFSLLKNDYEKTVWEIELTEELIYKEQDSYADKILHNSSDQPDLFYSGVILFYGYRLGALRLNNINECFTRQEGYRDHAVWSYNVDDILDKNMDDNNPDAGVSNLIEWIINPGSNTEVAENVLKKMILPLVVNLYKTIPPGKKANCTIVLPPMSKEIDIQDWSSIFAKLKVRELHINIVNYGHLLNLNNDERKYVVQYQTDGYKEYVIITAYELIRGHNTCIGSMAFDVEDSNKQYVLQDIKNISFTVDNSKKGYDRNEKCEQLKDLDFIEGKYPVSSGFISFLSNQSVSFMRELYKVTGTNENTLYDIHPIKEVFKENEALQVIEVCARVLQQQNLCNISLGDMVYVASIMKRNKKFETVTLKSNKAFQLGTYSHLESFVDISKIPFIPANHATFTWRIKGKRKSIVSYFNLDVKRHSQQQVIESIVDHFEHCTTEIVADELLYMYKDGTDPSAFFAAKLFIFLSQMESLEIESRNEIVGITGVE